MAKITANFHKEIATKVPKTKTITVPVEGEDYEIVIKNSLTLEEKTAMLQDVMSLAQVGVANEVKDGPVLILLGIYKALTDIEFPELPEEQMDQFNWLLETGIIAEIQKNLKPNLIEECVKTLEDYFILIAKQLNERKESQDKGLDITPVEE